MKTQPIVTKGAVGQRLATLGAMTLLLGACASPTHRAPMEDRVVSARTPAPAGSASATGAPGAAPTSTTSAATPDAAAKPPPPGAENAGKPGFYTVRTGDTLIRIGLETGQNWRDLARWNNIDNPNVLEVGQVVRVAPPGSETVATARPVAPAGRVESRPLDARPPAAAAPTASAPAAASGAVPTTAPAPAPAAAPAAVREPDDDVNWAWPAGGPVLGGFDEAKTKGLAIGGKAGDPVSAAADGRVVYAGSGLRGYGNLIIVKHNSTYLTAYAHNQTLLVKEDQVVRRGQKIAEMGSSDADRVQLHFEIRRQGKPVDPARLLPAR
jgi:lipoprotein NlpD